MLANHLCCPFFVGLQPLLQDYVHRTVWEYGVIVDALRLQKVPLQRKRIICTYIYISSTNNNTPIRALLIIKSERISHSKLVNISELRHTKVELSNILKFRFSRIATLRNSKYLNHNNCILKSRFQFWSVLKLGRFL